MSRGGAIPVVGKWLSDLLLLDPDTELPGTLDAALGSVRPSTRVRSGDSLVLFWPWYGGGEAMETTVSLTREGRGFLRNVLEWTGLARRAARLAGVRWTEAGSTMGVARAIRLRLPELAPG